MLRIASGTLRARDVLLEVRIVLSSDIVAITASRSTDRRDCQSPRGTRLCQLIGKMSRDETETKLRLVNAYLRGSSTRDARYRCDVPSLSRGRKETTARTMSHGAKITVRGSRTVVITDRSFANS